MRKLLREIHVRFEERKNCEFVDPGRVLSSKDAYTAVKALATWDREALVTLFLSSRCDVIGYEISGVGGINACGVRVNGLLRSAVQCGAASLIVCHNHPSGDPQPSEEDRKVTVQIRDASKILELTLLDHIIIGHDKHFSFATETELLKTDNRLQRRARRRNRPRRASWSVGPLGL
ncbi:MAG: JAB domain-containing protein [Nitrospirae bacterium]|nr:JAB domain-containing protein [Nitrospirota bacterium]